MFQKKPIALIRDMLAAALLTADLPSLINLVGPRGEFFELKRSALWTPESTPRWSITKKSSVGAPSYEFTIKE